MQIRMFFIIFSFQYETILEVVYFDEDVTSREQHNQVSFLYRRLKCHPTLSWTLSSDNASGWLQGVSPHSTPDENNSTKNSQQVRIITSTTQGGLGLCDLVFDIWWQGLINTKLFSCHATVTWPLHERILKRINPEGQLSHRVQIGCCLGDFSPVFCTSL